MKKWLNDKRVLWGALVLTAIVGAWASFAIMADIKDMMGL